jgi:IclR family transcriptional regulator, KDG regulon repressor
VIHIPNKNKTVVKSMDLLNLFIDHPKLSLNEIVNLSGEPKTSVHRMVGSLEGMGFLQRDKEGRFSLGLLFLQFGQLVSERLDIREIALPIMTELRDDIGEAVNLIIRDGNEAIYIEKKDTIHPVRLYTKIGRRAPLYAGACSRIILAFLPIQEQEEYLKAVELKAIGTGTIIDKDKLRMVLEESKKNGYTISNSELENNTFSIAAPIFDYTGNIIAGLSIAGPNERLLDERIPEILERLKKSTDLISQKLGWADTMRTVS